MPMAPEQGRRRSVVAVVFVFEDFCDRAELVAQRRVLFLEFFYPVDQLAPRRCFAMVSSPNELSRNTGGDHKEARLAPRLTTRVSGPPDPSGTGTLIVRQVEEAKKLHVCVNEFARTRQSRETIYTPAAAGTLSHCV